MSLAETFLRCADASTREAFTASPALEDGLQRLLREGRARWPQMEVPPERYLEFLARHLPPEAASPDELGALRAADLYLVCAYGLQARAAHQAIEAEYMPRVRQALGRLRTPDPVVLDIQQELRQRLVEMADPAIGRRGYSGRGDLAGWMVLCAVREAGARRRRSEQESLVEDALLDALPAAADWDPEMEVLVRTYKEPFQRAVVEALASLTARERNLLRYRFVGRASIDQIAQVYRVHRATAARWVLRAQARLIEQTQALFLSRTPMSPDSMTQIVVAIRSQLTLDLETLLVPAAEPEPR
jgi:RNA polymerase sigma-70 factor (ECF subfamily)